MDASEFCIFAEAAIIVGLLCWLLRQIPGTQITVRDPLANNKRAWLVWFRESDCHWRILPGEHADRDEAEQVERNWREVNDPHGTRYETWIACRQWGGPCDSEASTLPVKDD